MRSRDGMTAYTERRSGSCRRCRCRCLLAHISGPIYYFDTMRCGLADLDGILMAACHVELSWLAMNVWARFGSRFGQYHI